MHYSLSTDWHLHGLVVPGWRVHGDTEFLVTLFIVAVVVLVQSAVKAAENAVRTSFNVKSRCRKLLLHSFATLLLAIDVFLGYVLMLAVMSGNVWVLLTVLGSSTLGYALVWWVVVPLGPRVRRRPRRGRSDSNTDAAAAAASQSGMDGRLDPAGASLAAAAAGSSRSQTELIAETRPLVEAPLAPARDAADGGALPMANGKTHVLSTFSTTPPHVQERMRYQEVAPETEVLITGPRWQSVPGRTYVETASALEHNGGPGMATNQNGWQPNQPQPDVVYGGGWQDSGGDLYNKYPVLTKYRKLDFDQEDGTRENIELSELDCALQELTQQLQA